MRITKIFLLSLIFLLILFSCASASISVQTVNKAWSRISHESGLKNIPIIIENSKKANSYVKFQSKYKYNIYFTTGLMKILDSEEQAAGILAHEIGHIMLGHYEDNMSRKFAWTTLGILLSRAKLPVKAAGGLGMTLAEKGFSRGQEVQADDYAINLLVKAGYNPYALYKAMKKFAKHNYITKESGFNSHPPTLRRLKHLQYKAKELDRKQ